MKLSDSTIEKKLEELNLVFPDIPIPGGNYQSVVVRGHVAFVAIQFPIRNQEYLFTGRLGDTLTIDQGYKALQLCALNVLAQIKTKVGFENVEGLNHLDVYYQSNDTWDEAPLVANGASDLFINVLKEQGQHTRAILGVNKLPRNFSVGLVSSFTLL